MCYDSEEENDEQRDYEARVAKKNINAIMAEEAAYKAKQKKETFYDIEKEVKTQQKFKAAEGVKFKEFDALGLPTDDGFNYYEHICTDKDTLDTVIEASPAQMMLAMHPKGERFDRDKEDHELNEEGKQLH